jgi:hypothetical protein
MSARSPFLRTGAALVVLAALGAYIYFVESKQPAAGTGEPKQKALAFDKPKVAELEIAPRDGEAIRLVKEKDAWRMVAPLQVAADGNEADAMLTSLENLEIDEVVTESPADLAAFGLASPQRAVGVRLEGASEPLKLLIGDKTPDGTSVYAKLPTRPRVFTVASYQTGAFEKKPFDLRDRGLLKVKRDAVKTLEITGPGESYALARDDTGEWAFTRPIASLAGRWSVDGLLGALEALRMDAVAAEDAKDLKPFGLDKPVRSVTLGLADGATRRIEIGSSPEERKYHAREASSSLVAVIPAALVDDLAKGMRELRAKRVVDVGTYEVEGVEVEAEGKKTVLARTKEKDAEGFEQQKWARTAPDKKDLDRAKVDDALFKLTGLEVQEFLDTPGSDASYGLDAPAAVVTLKREENKAALSLRFGKKDGAAYARRPGDAAVLKLDSAKVDEALKAFKEL